MATPSVLGLDLALKRSLTPAMAFEQQALASVPAFVRMGRWVKRIGAITATRSVKNPPTPYSSDTPFYSETQRRLVEIESLGVRLQGSSQIPSSYLDDIIVILQAAQTDNQPMRTITLLPWYAVPIMWVVNLPLLPIDLGSFIVALPHRASFRYLVAYDAAAAKIRSHPEIVQSLGVSQEQAIAALAHQLSTSPPFHGHRTYALPTFRGLSFFAYVWSGLLLLTGGALAVLSIPIKVTSLLVGLIVWVTFVLRPISRFAASLQDGSIQNQSRRSRWKEHILSWVFRLPKLALLPFMLSTFLFYVPGEPGLRFRLPQPFAPIADIIRAYHDGENIPNPGEQPQFARRVTPLFFRPPTKRQLQRPLSPKEIKPDVDIVQKLEERSPNQQVLTVTEAPAPAAGNPAEIFESRFVHEFGMISTGDYSALRNYLMTDQNIDETTRRQLLEEFEKRFIAGGWAFTQPLQLTITQKEGEPWVLKDLKLAPDQNPSPPSIPNQQDIRVASRAHRAFFVMVGIAVALLAVHSGLGAGAGLLVGHREVLQAGVTIFLAKFLSGRDASGLLLSRRGFIKSGLSAAAVAAALPAMGQTRQQTPVPDAKAINDTIRLLSSLPDRRTGSPGFRQTAQFLKNQLSAYGYSDYGYSKGQGIEGDIEGMQTYVGVYKKGRNPKARKIVLMAHADSWTAFGPNAPGADDNASGTSAILEIARLMAGNDYDSDIAVIFTLDEERVQFAGSHAMKKLAKKGFTPDNTWVINVDSIGLSKNDNNPNIVVTTHMGDTTAEFSKSTILLPHDVSAAIPVVHETKGERVNDIGQMDGAILAALYGYSATSIHEPIDNKGEIHHTTTDVYQNMFLGAVPQVARWLLEAVERQTVHRKDGTPRAANIPEQMPSDHEPNWTQEVEAMFALHGIRFETDGTWPISESTYRSLKDWMNFVEKRWPSFNQRIHRFLYSASPPSNPPSDTLTFAGPLDRILVRDLSWMNETYGPYYETTIELLTRQLGQKLLGQKTYGQMGFSVLPPDKKILNELTLAASDFASMFLWGHVMSEMFMGRLSAESGETVMIDLAPEAGRREAFMNQKFKELGVQPFHKPLKGAKFNPKKYLMPMRRAPSTKRSTPPAQMPVTRLVLEDMLGLGPKAQAIWTAVLELLAFAIPLARMAVRGLPVDATPEMIVWRMIAVGLAGTVLFFILHRVPVSEDGPIDVPWRMGGVLGTAYTGAALAAMVGAWPLAVIFVLGGLLYHAGYDYWAISARQYREFIRLRQQENGPESRHSA